MSPPSANTSSYAKMNASAPTSTTAGETAMSAPAPLSVLPYSTVLRSLVVATVSSSPALLNPGLRALSLLSDSKYALFNPDRNLALKYALGKTMYTQFCAGEAPAEVRRCVQEVRGLGFSGVILGYAPEVVFDDADAVSAGLNAEEDRAAEIVNAEIDFWRSGTLDTVDLAGDGGFVALKFTGAGRQALDHLLRRLPPSPKLEEAIVEICERAKSRNARLLFDAEQQAVQPTIDDWTMEFQRRYNNGPDRRALVYGTYQAYLRSTPATLSQHMAVARSEGFVLGVKLVRGAYLGTESRHVIWATKEETDNTYNGLAEGVIKGEYGQLLKPESQDSSESSRASFPEVNLILASHNRASVLRARALHDELSRAGRRRIEMEYGQIYGMADDLSCDLVHGNQSRHMGGNDANNVEVPKVYKSVVWGSVGHCMKYLLRRAQENKDAASRTQDTRNAMAKELKRRVLGT